MISKLVANAAAALADVPDGATVMIGGFGTAGQPMELIDALLEQGAKDLVIINNNAGNGTAGLAALLGANRVRKIICSFPRQVDSQIFDGLYRSGKIELELVPQGNLAERIRAAGAGIGAFFTPTGYGTPLAEGKETREINGRQYVLEYPLHADYALIKAERGDRWGNLVYRKTARNFGPIMASAARVAVAQVREIVELGELDPENVVTPASSCNAWCGSTPPRPPRNSNEPKQTEPRRDRRARRPRHSRRRLREPGYRPADPGRQPPAGRPRSHPAHRERHAGHGSGAGQGRRGLRPDQRRQAARDRAARLRLLPPCRFLRHDARRPSGHLRAGRLPGVAARRPGQLAHRRPDAIPAVGGAMDLAIGARTCSS